MASQDAGDGLDLQQVGSLAFGPGDPVRSASALVRLGAGWLVAQDDAVHAAWWRPPATNAERVRVLPARDGVDEFSAAAGTKRAKPDLEAGCTVPLGRGTAALLLGSGSLPPRRVAVVARQRDDGTVEVAHAELPELYERVAAALGLDDDQVNLEGACMVDGCLRWFQRGHGGTGVPSASVDLDVGALLGAVLGGRPVGDVVLSRPRRHRLGALDGLDLAITDAVVLPDGTVCVSATAEDAPDAVADGPVAGSVLALLDDDGPVVVPLPPAVAAHKVEGLAVAGRAGSTVDLLAVVDADDPALASPYLGLRLDAPAARRAARRR